MSSTAQCIDAPVIAPAPAAIVAKRDWVSAIELTILGAIWGSSFLFMRIASTDFSPFPLVVTRLALGALILSPFLWQVRAQIHARHWLRFAIIGALNSAIPFALFAWGAERAPAGIGAIANSMTVLFAVLVAMIAFGERIGKVRAVALVAGFVGVVVLASGRTAGANVGMAALAGTLASLCYGIAGNLTKHYLADIKPTAAAAGTLICATFMIAPLAVWQWPQAQIPTTSWLSAITLGVLCTGIAYAFYFRLIGRIGASRASTTTYLVPLFGVFWAWLFLAEVPTATMLIAAALILGSVILSQKAGQVTKK